MHRACHILYAQKMLATITAIIGPSCRTSYLLSNKVGGGRGESGVLMLINSPPLTPLSRKETCSGLQGWREDR